MTLSLFPIGDHNNNNNNNNNGGGVRLLLFLAILGFRLSLAIDS